MIPDVSVIVPTHNRSASLLRTLRSLASQSLPPRFEVVVVADGCVDDTPRVVRDAQASLPVLLVEQERAGAAAARNRGAARASAPILLFLDDDMEASAGLVASHLDAHTMHPGGAVLGYFPMPSREKAGRVETATRRWWDEQFASRALAGHRFTFWDVCTGNLSLPRDVFDAIGGFDERIGAGTAGEDFEFGVRLVMNRVPLRFVREAASVHHDQPTTGRAFRRARQEGHGQSLIAQKHPELFWYFHVSRLSRLDDSLLLRPLWQLLWRRPWLAAPVAGTFRFGLRAAELLRRPGLTWRLHGALWNYHYWRGVLSAFGTLSAWERLRQDAPVEAPHYRELELDLAKDLDHLDGILKREPVDAVRLTYYGTPLGRVAPIPGAEPLRPAHIRHAVMHRFGGVAMHLMLERALAGGSRADLPAPAHTTAPRTGGVLEGAVQSE